MVQPHSFLSSEIVPPINFTWTGDVSISFGDSTFAILVLVVVVWLSSHLRMVEGQSTLG